MQQISSDRWAWLRVSRSVVRSASDRGGRLRSQGPARGPISAPRDLELEKQSYRNLDVAKFYYHKRKPEKNDKAGWERINKAVESRLLEIVDTNPGICPNG
jgi:hypothetical protein